MNLRWCRRSNDRMASDLEIRVLGELVVTRGGRSLPLPASKKTRALLGYLAVTGRSHTRERLCELLWPGPDDPRAALRWSLTKLRSVLGQKALEADRERVALGTVATDLTNVRSIIGRDLEAAGLVDLSTAVSRFRGELCEGLGLPDCYRYQEWHTAERQAARGLHESLLTTLVRRLASDPAQALALRVRARGRGSLSRQARTQARGPRPIRRVREDSRARARSATFYGAPRCAHANRSFERARFRRGDRDRRARRNGPRGHGLAARGPHALGPIHRTTRRVRVDRRVARPGTRRGASASPLRLG